MITDKSLYLADFNRLHLRYNVSREHAYEGVDGWYLSYYRRLENEVKYRCAVRQKRGK